MSAHELEKVFDVALSLEEEAQAYEQAKGRIPCIDVAQVLRRFSAKLMNVAADCGQHSLDTREIGCTAN